MATEETFEEDQIKKKTDKSGFSPLTGIYRSVLPLSSNHRIPTDPNLNTAAFVLSLLPPPEHAETKIALIDSATDRRLTYSRLRRSVLSLAASLHHAVGVRKGDVVLLLSPNSILYPTICLAVLATGGVITTVNPLYTAAEVAKQVRDSGAKLAISTPEEAHKLASSGVPTLLTTRPSDGGDSLSVEELIEGGEPLDAPVVGSTQSDVAALLYSSGTTGVSKGVVLTHANLISIVTLLRWTVDVTSAEDDVYLGFLPMFHIYGLAYFALGLLCLGSTTVVMARFDMRAMLEAVERYGVSNIPVVPPVLLGLAKGDYSSGWDLSSLRRVGTGAAPLSTAVAKGFRERFPWVELRQGYGLTESSGAATFFMSEKAARRRPESVGQLLPEFEGKVVEVGTGRAVGPYGEGELWLRGPSVMKGYLENEEATLVTIDEEGWLRTGDLVYFDDGGFMYVVDRIKELIKHNGYQVAPAELEALLLTHPHVLDAAVVPLEDEEVGQIPMAYVVRSESGAGEEEIIQFVASQVAPYKKIRKVTFINAIPRSAAGKILRKQLVAQNQHAISSKL